MADSSPENPETPEGGNLVQRLHAWAAAHPKRSIMVGGGLIGLTVATTLAWIVIASLAAPTQNVTLEDALRALDNGDLEYAGDMAAKMQAGGNLEPNRIGGPLFVLGAIRAEQASQEFSPEHRRRGYLIAAGYLANAHEAGFPAGREHDGLYLLGKSLIKGNQLQRGVNVLQEALTVDPDHVEDIHRLIAEAQFFSEQPVFSLVLKHLDMALATSELKEPERSEAQILKAQTLSAIGRFPDAFEVLKTVSKDTTPLRVMLVESQIRIEQLTLLSSQPDPQQELIEPLAAQAKQLIHEIIAKDELATQGGAPKYLMGRLDAIIGDTNIAQSLFEEVLQSYGQEVDGIAAAMAQARLLQERGLDEKAIHQFRIALDSIDDPVQYRSELLPLLKLRNQVLAAHSAFLAQNKHHAAAELVERIYPVFSRNRQLELKANTFESWGHHMIHRADLEKWNNEQLRAEGRAKLREAGVNYELLADSRFATKRYPEHLWHSADSYFQGQSYQSAMRVLRDYLKNEPEQRNALALLRLGQTRLAMGHPFGAIDAFNECIEFHPQDAATFQSRLECAKAYRETGDPKKAEEFLRQNLVGGTLKPQSPEWMDSLFELGNLLHDKQQYSSAITKLEEFVARVDLMAQRNLAPERQLAVYQHQTRLAKYLIAEAYRHAADEPLEKYEAARTVNERERNLRDLMNFLKTAADNYEIVRRDIAVQSSWSTVDRAMIRNCYMFKGSVLFQQGVLEQDEAKRARRDKKKELSEEHTQKAQQYFAGAVQAYSDLSAQFQDEPIILEVFVQIAHCWRRMDDTVKARGQISRALAVLDQLPRDTDFASTTSLTRNEWESMLNEMINW